MTVLVVILVDCRRFLSSKIQDSIELVGGDEALEGDHVAESEKGESVYICKRGWSPGELWGISNVS